MKTEAPREIGRVSYLRVVGIRITVCNIFANRRGQNHAFLQHQRDVLAQIFHFDRARIVFVQFHRPLHRIVKSRQKIQQRGLPTPLGPTNATISPGLMTQLTSSKTCSPLRYSKMMWSSVSTRGCLGR